VDLYSRLSQSLTPLFLIVLGLGLALRHEEIHLTSMVAVGLGLMFGYWLFYGFCVSFGQRLPFRANLFDGAILCASLQSTAEPEAMVSEVRRVLAPGGRIACLERNWQGEQGRPTGPVVLKRFYLAHGELFHQLFYQFSERLPIPGRERNYRYRIDPESDFGRMILANQQLLEQHTLPTRMDADELPLESITAAWFDESSGFTPETLTELFERAGLSDIHLEVATLWSREEQMLLTCRLPE
jgi:ubiquinone/menaquinone biosynthesis C-methylase UbiE